MKTMAIIVALVVSNTVAFAGTKETKPAATTTTTTTTTNVEAAAKPADPHAAPAVKVKEVAKPAKDSTKK